jgi:crotonobetainyl-CoA:carnitine CoA-transferase CaiB-like acyl-CoA transferase
MPPEGPLAGVRVLEVGHLVSAPFAAKLLADYGAQVIKVEPPGGDPARRYGPFPAQPAADGALFLYLNTNKQSLVLDLTSAADQERFRRLAAEADLVIENLPPGTLAGWGLGYAELARRNPRLVMVSLAPFGQDGPYAGYAATNLTTLAMGGQLALTGDPDREPLKQAGFQGDYQLGLNGFAAAVIALYGARVSGLGQHVDVAAVECMASTLEHALNTYAYTGRLLAGRRGNVRSATIGLYECADGYLGVHAMPRNLPFLLELMGMPELLKDERFATPAARLQHNDELVALFTAWALGQHKKDVYARAGYMRAPVAYVHTLQDLLDSPQLNARGYWQTVEHPVAGRLTYPGPPVRMSDSPWRVGRAPLLGEGPGTWTSDAAGPDRPPPARGRGDGGEGQETALPLAGVRVLDLTMVWAGPYGTRILADMGAEVIKVEAVNFYDQLRNLAFLPPGTERTWNKSAYFNHNNRNKFGCTLDLATPRGRELFLELVKTADVVVENYRAEVLDRLGLGYEVLRAARPDIILVSMPGHGKDGPERDYVAYGTNIEQLAGLVALTGYLGGPPHASGISYGDPIAGTAMAGAVALALLHRARTGRGQYVELAQREVLTALIGEYIVGYSITGRQPAPLGNRHPLHAPHGVYPARAPGEVRHEDAPGAALAQPAPREPWIAIACETDAQFAALCAAMGRPELARDSRFATAAARKAHEEELDGLIAAWTADQDKLELFHRLQAVGVPCGPVLNPAEVFFDPHLRARGFFEWVTHPEAGTWDMEGPIYRLSRTPAHIRINAPCFGEHNGWVLAHLLGLPEGELTTLSAEGIIGTEPNMAVHQ